MNQKNQNLHDYIKSIKTVLNFFENHEQIIPTTKNYNKPMRKLR